jgi:type IX secretion system PorP/SprF family membrane protein
MKKISLLLAVLALLAINTKVNQVFAQQDPQYSMYMFNPLAVNPAYAGGRDRLALVALYRDQWTGLAGAPRTFSLTAHAPLLDDRIGVGGSISNDNLGVLNMINGTADFSYRLPVGKGKLKGRLCFGLSASVDYFSNRLTETVIIDNGDPNFSINHKATNVNFGAGAY